MFRSDLLRASAAILALLAASLSREAAAEMGRARVVLEPCAQGPLDPRELMRLLAIELAPNELAIVETSTAVDVFLTIAVPTCGPSASRIELAAIAAGDGLTQTVRLDRRSRGNARTVALAAAELVRSLRAKELARVKTSTAWTPTAAWEAALVEKSAARARAQLAAEAQTKNTRAVVVPARAPSEVGSTTPAPNTDTIAVYLGVDAYPSAGSALPTLAFEARIATSTSSHLQLAFGAGARAGLEREVRGRVELTAAFASFAARTTYARESLHLAAGPRITAGYVTAAGHPDSAELNGERIHGFLAELWMELSLEWSITPRWSAGARTAAGYVLSGLSARADGVELTGVDGAALGFALSTAVAF